jgi:alanine racemase
MEVERSVFTLDCAIRRNTRRSAAAGGAELWAVVRRRATGIGAVDVARRLEAGVIRALRRHFAGGSSSGAGLREARILVMCPARSRWARGGATELVL